MKTAHRASPVFGVCAILVAWVVIGTGLAAETAPRATDAGSDAGSDAGTKAKPASSETPDDAEVAANLELLEDLPTVEALDLIQNLAPDP